MKPDIQPIDPVNPEEARSGFRLQRLEVLNWGTFNGSIWCLDLEGRNTLLTGDIGSGKSTLVDAVTTLLVPAHRIAYNKAAGAESKERSLRSYVLGHYKSERSEDGGAARPIALRKEGSLSILLGVFTNEGYDQAVTLAQVFWIKEGQAQPARFFVMADQDLSIARDFSGLVGDVARLKKQLRARGAEVEDSFSRYASWYRRRFGIENEQAMELFHQTVSMKSVGNLTDFVRAHMLEPFDVSSRIEALMAHFDDLNRAHEAVLKAQRQLSLLQPMMALCEKHQALADRTAHFKACREGLSGYFSQVLMRLLEKRQADQEQEWNKREAKVRQTELARQAGQLRIDEIRRVIQQNGGDRLEQLAAEIDLKGVQRDARKQKAERYAHLARILGQDLPGTAEQFLEQRAVLSARKEDVACLDLDLQNRYTEETVELLKLREQHRIRAEEIDSLKRRRSNIDVRQIEIREALCHALKVEETTMPFVGELLRIRAEERAWEGAIERLLRGFGLSLLVPEVHYRRVAEWVDGHHLRGRLVYFHVRPPRSSELPALSLHSLVRKLEVRPDSSFYDWLERELVHRFDIACCETPDEFRREPRAVTRAGQLKDPSGRHEKDDRSRLDDRARYVLGWSNQAKIAALEATQQALESDIQRVSDRIGQVLQRRSELSLELDALIRLEEFLDFEEMDWGILEREIAVLQSAREALAQASDRLKTLRSQLEEAQVRLAEADKAHLEARDLRAYLSARREETDRLLAMARDKGSLDPLNEALKDVLTGLVRDILGTREVTIEGCAQRESEVRKWIQDKMDDGERQGRLLADRIIRQMSEFNGHYRLETADFEPSLASVPDYARLLAQLERDDLPRFVDRFKELLNVNTINEIANFNAQLSRERETIKERIDRINRSLTQIDYNKGRYIRLEAMPTLDTDIREFQAELRACTEGVLSGTEEAHYSELRFMQVRRIIDRFKGREGLFDLDRRWTSKVTDVRNWFNFAASERWREDDAEFEHYSDSGGKSGGQKEKLAYTILAASLAYQFGLEWGALRSRSFRFVVIDEAFGRGSDESTRFGLELFQKLKLQLLIVTPLQKIHVIEPFIAGVGFVHNEGGRNSKILNLSIEAYHERLRALLSQANPARPEEALQDVDQTD